MQTNTIALTLSVLEGRFLIASILMCEFLYLWRVEQSLCSTELLVLQGYNHSATASLVYRVVQKNGPPGLF